MESFFVEARVRRVRFRRRYELAVLEQDDVPPFVSDQACLSTDNEELKRRKEVEESRGIKRSSAIEKVLR